MCLSLAQKLILIDTGDLVVTLNHGDRRFAHADNADLIRFD